MTLGATLSVSVPPPPPPCAPDDPHAAARRAAVHATGLLDTPAESAYDDVTELAAEICDTPVAFISLSDDARLWFKSVKGLPCRETSSNGAMCTYTIRQNQPLTIGDLAKDERFCQSPAVTALNLRFYTGIPLRNEAGLALGSLCVVDFRPRTLSLAQNRALHTLARQIETEIILREKVTHLEAANQQREALSDALAASEARFRQFMDFNPAAVFIKDAAGRMLYCNAKFAGLFRSTTDRFIGKFDAEVWSPEQAEGFRAADLSVLQHHHQIEIEERVDLPESAPLFLKTYKFPIRDRAGDLCLAGVTVDVSSEKRYAEDLREANARLESLIMLDPLTALGNRRALDLTLRQSIHTAAQQHTPLGLLMIDVDHFKRLNDTHGHSSGDDVLRHIGEVLRRIIRRVDHVCRYGGEEFAVMLPGADREQTECVAERIRSEIEALRLSSGSVTVSIGGALWNSALPAPADLLTLADSALYSAKRAGRNRVLMAA